MKIVRCDLCNALYAACSKYQFLPPCYSQFKHQTHVSPYFTLKLPNLLSSSPIYGGKHAATRPPAPRPQSTPILQTYIYATLDEDGGLADDDASSGSETLIGFIISAISSCCCGCCIYKTCCDGACCCECSGESASPAASSSASFSTANNVIFVTPSAPVQDVRPSAPPVQDVRPASAPAQHMRPLAPVQDLRPSAPLQPPQ